MSTATSSGTAEPAPRVSSLVPTTKKRAGRVTPAQSDALSRLWPRFGVAVDGSPLDPVRLFGRVAPLVLEIGFGMGEATAEMAAAEPARDVLAVDMHAPGLGNLLRLVESRGLSNVRLAQGDARVLLADMLGPGSVDEVRIFFPDPWPKKRHHKRRLVTSGFCDLVAARLAPGGLVHVATDWPPYAEWVREVFDAHPAFTVSDEVPSRSRTRFERQGLDAGRPPHDIVAVRVADRAGP